ncbi:DUF4255 domain-containing protein [Amycolatopsis anabasis]|uniref:DUF4255 domain-containing protein n=1 Tax=Amycolatopsis anabasis TaxID=1840409 RepID=UPI00131ACD3F|nr:DUF4255 domain-containing protein [Amycolatopsis anabasis]
MIHEVDEALRALITDGAWLGSQIEVVFDAPTRDWAARRNAPTINVFLYDVREDLARRGSGRMEEHDEQGELLGWRPPPRWYHLSYLVTAWTSRAPDEHRLLSALLARFGTTELLPRRTLGGSLAETGLNLPLQAARPLGEGRSLSELWSALGGELKPSIDLLVTAPQLGELTPVGAAVTDGLVLSTEAPFHADADAEQRRLRYPEPATSGPYGDAPEFGAHRPRTRRRMGER